MSARARGNDEADPVLVWFRDDLRLADNPALHAAVGTGCPLICLYVFEPATPGIRPLGAAARWWLHGSLQDLDTRLRASGGQLLLLKGEAREVVPRIVAKVRAQGVFWNRRYGEAERHIDQDVKTTLRDMDVEADSFNGHLLHEPWTVMSSSGTSFRVFSAFWRAARALGAPASALPAPSRLGFSRRISQVQPESIALEQAGLAPKTPDWAQGMRAAWVRGETGACERLAEFLQEDLPSYAVGRDAPAKSVTSRLSPYLRFGNVSVRQIWNAASAQMGPNLEKFRAELGWREFSYHLLYHFPEMARRNLQGRFDAFPWRHDQQALMAWQSGRTGYPLVDAGMRELWTTGWMHNRVRMVVASFLVKDLLIDWREGEAWFWNTLVDADPASNAASWQWVAGSGADAAPFFRVFNPVLQGEKFDPDGVYVRRWLPELAALPARFIHRPWEAPSKPEYPSRVVDHDEARILALEAFKSTASAAR